MIDIDTVLTSLGMGRYQFVGCVLFGLVIMYSNVSPVAYVFTAGDLRYRCEIPECDAPNPAERVYEPLWLRYTTPYKDDMGPPRKCQRYVALADRFTVPRCGPNEFATNMTERCENNWVFKDKDNTIGKEFGLMCEENKWKLTMVGTVNSIGQAIGIPISGIIADKFGRKFAMVFCAATSAALSIAQSFSTSYIVFLVLELMSSIVSSGIYTVTFVLAMESVLPKQRVLYYSLMECFYPVGAILVAEIAKHAKDWKLLLRISNVPGLMFLSYFWLTEESMKWLEMQGKHDRVLGTLKKIATVNKKPLPDLSPDVKTEVIEKQDDESEKKFFEILNDVIHSPTIFWRLIRCSLVWISITLIYYGLTISAVDIAGDKYLNFELVSFVEIPACALTWLIMEVTSRKTSLSSMLLLSGATCVMYILTTDNYYLIKLLVFMISKLAIAIAFNIAYILTAEIFPTQLRATTVSICSMLGRIGSALAPQVTLLAEYYGGYVTMLVFAITALVAAAITMTLPESKNVRLPDTIDEAEQIGNDVKPENGKNSSQ